MLYGTWHRARVRKKISRSVLERLVRQQAESVPIAPMHSESVAFVGSNARIDTSHHRQDVFRCFTRRLESQFRWKSVEDSSDIVSTGLISQEKLFPPEWRNQALRTFLHHQLPEQLQIWREWWKDIRRGRFDAYMRRLYEHETSIGIHTFMRRFVQTARGLGRRKQIASLSGDLLFAVSRILELKPPDILAPPRDDARFDRSTTGEDDDYLSMTSLVETIDELLIEWRSVTPQFRSFGMLQDYVPTYEVFLHGKDGRDMERFFDWGFECVDAGLSLLFQ